VHRHRQGRDGLMSVTVRATASRCSRRTASS
jgi:hypothetical protein